ncbi:MAG TPA: lasso peptide biosynthesis B2 protein [Blastocatellia bacterium]|nr:lasso peptide biosynthesis B2 protein [Blastocatellia bacterium]
MLKSLARMSAVEAVLATQLVIAAGVVELALRLVAFQRLVSLVRRIAGMKIAAMLPFGRHSVEWERLLSLTFGAVRLWRGKDGCLRRSLILLWLFISEGREAVLVIGVRKDSSEPFMGHAWIEVDNRPIQQDMPGLTRFAELSRY